MTDTCVRLGITARVATVTLDRPPVNALSEQMYREIGDTFRQLGSNPDVSAVVVTSSNPRVFCAGADIREVADVVGQRRADADAARQVLAREVFDQILSLPRPTIAAVAGYALGAGAVIAACCDMRVGSPQTRIGLPEINVGRCGGARHLMRLLPQGVVRQLYFTGDPLGSDDAFRLGLLNSVHDPAQVDDAAQALAQVIAAKSPVALRVGKASLNACESLPVREGYALEQQHTLELARTDDAREALAAMLEKREPRFTGH